MITKNKILVFLGLATILSCNKEEIEVVKNFDTDTNPSKDLVDKDIRTRLGYDPRIYYASFAGQEVEMPIFTLGTLQINRDVVGTMAVTFDKPLDKETTVTVEYDASVFDKVKDKYEGYSLGNQSLAEFTSTEVVIPKGESVALFELKMPNRGTEKLLLPYTFKVKGNDSAKIEETKNYFVAKVYTKEIEYEVRQSTKQTSTVYFDRTRILKIENPTITMDVSASEQISDDIRLGLVRDNSISIDGVLAPNNIQDAIEEIDFKDKKSGAFSFNLKDDVLFSKMTTHYAEIPFKLVVYDKEGVVHKELKEGILATFFAFFESAKIFDSSTTEFTDLDYLFRVDKNDFEFDKYKFGRVTDSDKMFDGSESTYGSFSANRTSLLAFTFKDEARAIKAIRFKTTPTHILKGFRLRVTDNEYAGGFRTIGTFTFAQNKDGYAIIFDDPVDIRWIYLDRFVGEENTIQMAEIEFFEE